MTTEKDGNRELKTERQKDAETERERNKEERRRRRKIIENPNNCKLSILPTIALWNLQVSSVCP